MGARSGAIRTLRLLDRAALRKLAVDAGFDLVSDGAEWIEAASSQAPLRASLAMDDDGRIALGLSMPQVARRLAEDERLVASPAPTGAPSAPAWLWFDTLAEADAALGRAWALSRTLPTALVARYRDEVRQALAGNEAAPSATEREAVVRQRIGQQLFREGLMTLWQGQCAISGLAVPELLRASHAKPWADSSDDERLDVYNGLLLSANLDAAFDGGLLGVDDDGQVLVSASLPDGALALLDLARPRRIAVSDGKTPHRLGAEVGEHALCANDGPAVDRGNDGSDIAGTSSCAEPDRSEESNVAARLIAPQRSRPRAASARRPEAAAQDRQRRCRSSGPGGSARGPRRAPA